MRTKRKVSNRSKSHIGRVKKARRRRMRSLKRVATNSRCRRKRRGKK